MKIYTINQIKSVIDLRKDLKELIKIQEKAFVDFSYGLINVPHPMQVNFHKSHGDCHIKAGFKENNDIFIVKVATGFYQNSSVGLPAGDGVVLVFSQKVGLLKAILYDGGFLTTLRTALAAAVAAKVTPWKIQHIGIIGTGQLATQTIAIMKLLYPNATFNIWGRSAEKTKALASSYGKVQICQSIKDLVNYGGIVITTTASTKSIIDSSYITNQTHIIALGTDEIGKQECAPCLFDTANAVIVDSKEQAVRFGDAFYAIQGGFITHERIEELGNVIQKSSLLNSAFKFIITDLTGIAAQDIAISQFVIGRFIKKSGEL